MTRTVSATTGCPTSAISFTLPNPGCLSSDQWSGIPTVRTGGRRNQISRSGREEKADFILRRALSAKLS
eukprot:747383-Hanusia_phi.AAC.6